MGRAMVTKTLALPLILLAFFSAVSAAAQEHHVRLWTPYAMSNQTFECIAADLDDWLLVRQQSGEQVPVPHQLIDLPEGRYLDQIAAAADTGELPDLLLGSVEVLSVLPGLEEGPFFGADLIGLWVDEPRLASLPAAQSAAATLWQGNGAANLSTFEEVLVLLHTQDHLGFGLDVGLIGEDLGLGLALMIEQWSLAFDNAEMPDWHDTSLIETLEILNAWQRDGLMREVNLNAGLGEQAIFTLARYSAGRGLGPDRHFYPLFGGIAGKGPAFLELDVNWYPTRPSAVPLYGDIFEAAAAGDVFNTCAETDGLLSYQQFVEIGAQEIMTIFGPRRGQAIDLETEVAIQTWTGLQPGLPAALTNVLRDIRAGLSIENALQGLHDLTS